MRFRRHNLAPGVLAASDAPTASATPPFARPQPPEQIAPLGPDFLWGVATSGFQSEGHAPDSNWSRYAASGAAP